MSTPPRRSFISNRAWNPERAIVPHAARWYARTARTYAVSAYLSSYQSEGRSIRSIRSIRSFDSSAERRINSKRGQTKRATDGDYSLISKKFMLAL